ncbi:PHP domain-containing protein [Parendozoicomonas haliclonae]|uniref:Polymerase/histidinol phosphatase N-terminal domain-containing protein n=1 Tax=Parendozoicomonas haliclonae TaxID=1960125 RepID=A0A1X7AQB9_9GAMM|nr:PHP domain-containing protein [Parendozoicomonas haliclonae]SMA50521.1 hypothetical protein EHSB41UT_04332 [Parendozoicomonas haliclonae]
MSQKVDFHCHSTASDGVLSPRQVLERAVAREVDYLALTDHDTVAGVRWLRDQGLLAQYQEQLTMVFGSELSCLWGTSEIHIVALGLDMDDPDVQTFLEQQGEARWQRSERIADKVARRLPGFAAEACLEGAVQQAQQAQAKADPDFILSDRDLQIGRPHFAGWMVEQGIVADRNSAFDKYLGAKRIGNARQHWPGLQETVRAIRSWNAVPVLAHPGRYRMTGMKLQEVIRGFKEAGGLAMEVVGCQQPWGERETMAKYCEKFELHASLGSDFHGPWSEYVELGRLAPVPENCRPVMELLEALN